jgi:hypothetical protein
MTQFAETYKLLKKKISFSEQQDAIIKQAINEHDTYLISRFTKIFDEYLANENLIAENLLARQNYLSRDFDKIKRTIKKNYIVKPMEKIEKKEKQNAEGILKELDEA